MTSNLARHSKLYENIHGLHSGGMLMNSVAQAIYRQIESGQLLAGENLQTPDLLLQEFTCDEPALHSALSDLVYEGFLERDPQNRDSLRVVKHPLWGTVRGNHSLTKEAINRGLEPGVDILDFKTVHSWPLVQERLDLGPEDDVIIMERLRSAGGRPISLEFSYFPEKLYPGMTAELFKGGGEGQSSFKVMEKKYKLVPMQAIDEVTTAAVEEREARLLGVDPGTPVLIRFRLTISDEGIPIKGSRAIYLFKAGYTLPI
jgi:GntR family transcriptional regulator